MDEHRALSTVHPDVARERSSVDLADPGHVPLPQVLVERRFARVVARYRTRPAHRQRAGPRPRGLGVRVTHPIVALQRIGHAHHLACIRRIRKDLLVAGHRGVEDDLSLTDDICAERRADEGATVLEHERGVSPFNRQR